MGEEDLNPFGFHRHPAGRRMPSMMAPTVVMRDGEVELVLGSAGSNRIRSALLQTIVGAVDHDLDARDGRRRTARPLRRRRALRRAGHRPRRAATGRAEGGCEIVRFAGPNLFFGGVQAVRRRGVAPDRRRRPSARRRRGERVSRAAALAASRCSPCTALGGLRRHHGAGPVHRAAQRQWPRREADPAGQRRRRRELQRRGCRNGRKLKLSDSALVRSARDPGRPAGTGIGAHSRSRPPPSSVLSYSVRDENGTVRFGDNSPGQPKVLRGSRCSCCRPRSACAVCRSRRLSRSAPCRWTARAPARGRSAPGA